MPNWIGIGSSSPKRSRKRAQRASVARSPSAALHGSPGRIRATAKTTKTIPIRTGIVRSTRRVMKRSIAGVYPDDRLADTRKGAAMVTAPFQGFGELRARCAQGRLLLGGVQELREEGREVLERSGAPDVQRMRRIPLDRVRGHHVVGIEVRPIMEAHALAQGAGERGQV